MISVGVKPLPLAETLRRARVMRGLKQLDVARAAGITNVYLSDIEHGKRGCALDTLYRLGTVLELDRADLAWRWCRDRLGDVMAERVAFYVQSFTPEPPR